MGHVDATGLIDDFRVYVDLAPLLAWGPVSGAGGE
jgi:hypothetical protein